MRYSTTRMFASWLNRILPLAVSLMVASCADSFAPPATEERPSGIDDSLLGQRTGESVSAGELKVLSHNLRLKAADGTPLIVKRQTAPNSAPPLYTYELEFWAVQGVEQTVAVYYLSDDDDTEQFLRFTVPENGLALRPDGTDIEQGDSVLITLQIDGSSVRTDFSPSGLIFNEEAPAELTIWYRGFLDESDIDEDDALPDFWYGEDATAEEWYHLFSDHNTDTGWVKTHVRHFSGYAISW